MVERVPGFIDERASVRGFGGTAGNVLIDGERPSAKAQSLREILGQIQLNASSRVKKGCPPAGTRFSVRSML